MVDIKTLEPHRLWYLFTKGTSKIDKMSLSVFPGPKVTYLAIPDRPGAIESIDAIDSTASKPLFEAFRKEALLASRDIKRKARAANAEIRMHWGTIGLDIAMFFSQDANGNPRYAYSRTRPLAGGFRFAKGVYDLFVLVKHAPSFLEGSELSHIIRYSLLFDTGALYRACLYHIQHPFSAEDQTAARVVLDAIGMSADAAIAVL